MDIVRFLSCLSHVVTALHYFPRIDTHPPSDVSALLLLLLSPHDFHYFLSLHLSSHHCVSHSCLALMGFNPLLYILAHTISIPHALPTDSWTASWVYTPTFANSSHFLQKAYLFFTKLRQ
jgi:hypothetical protein